MKIEIRFIGNWDPPRHARLLVGGYHISTWYGAGKKRFLDPQKWAEEAIVERTKEIDDALFLLDERREELIKEQITLNKK